MEDERIILAALDGLAAAFNAHDIDAIMGFFAEECSLDLPRGPDPHGSRYTGRDGVRRGSKPSTAPHIGTGGTTR